MPPIPRSLVPNHGFDKDNLATAIIVGRDMRNATGASKVTLITPRLNIDTTDVDKFFGLPLAKRLNAGESVKLPGIGLTMDYTSVAKVKKGRRPEVVLACHLSLADMVAVDGLAEKGVVYLPWCASDGDEWGAKWSASTPAGPVAGAAVSLDPEVEKMLRSVTGSVNLSTGLGHPSDKALVKQEFARLRSRGFAWDPAEVEKWAVRNGWSPIHAKRLAAL